MPHICRLARPKASAFYDKIRLCQNHLFVSKVVIVQETIFNDDWMLHEI